jgi:predicted MFS family arabinose efflux permease
VCRVPAGLVAVGLGWLLLPRSTELATRRRLDLAGLALLVPGLVAVLCALTLGPNGGVGVVGVLVLVCLGALLLGGFVRHERHAAPPLLDVALLRTPSVVRGVLGAAGSSAVLFGVLLAVPFYLERTLGLGVAAAGALLAVMPVALAVSATVSGRVAEHLDARRVTATGMLVVVAGLVSLAIAHADAGSIALALAVVGVGLGIFTPANNGGVMRAAPRTCAGQASGLLNMGRGLGTAVGLAATSLLLAVSGAGAGGRTLAVTATALGCVALACAALSFGGARWRGADLTPRVRRARLSRVSE